MTIVNTIKLNEDNIKEILSQFFDIPKDQINLQASTVQTGSEMSPINKTIISAELDSFKEVKGK